MISMEFNGTEINEFLDSAHGCHPSSAILEFSLDEDFA